MTGKLLRIVVLLMHFPLMGVCSVKQAPEEVVLVGSTPGDEPVKNMLSISPATRVDFIRWNLKLKRDKTFGLTIRFGESQPNTLGFKSGGETKNFEGSFAIDTPPVNKNFSEVYQLQSSSFAQTISLVKISENVFHILTPDSQLMIGNGGWSYTLNRSVPVDSKEILISSELSENRMLQVVFDGRTPCREIALEHPEMNASRSCFKLKWKLILNRDSITCSPTTCVIRKVVDSKALDVTGKWTIIQGTPENPRIVIYKIETGHPTTQISFLVCDENVLYFLDKHGDPFTGNENFSFSLNRRTSR